LNGFTATLQARTIALSAFDATNAPNAVGSAILLTDDNDLNSHGGEDAVWLGAVGSLWHYGGRANPTTPAASAFWLRVILAQTDVNPAGSVFPADYTTAAGLGRDDVLGCWHVLCSGTTVIANGTAAAAETGTLPLSARLDIRVKARRKLQQDRQLVLWWQTMTNGGGAATPVDFLLTGHLRMLMRRPR